MRGHEQIIAMRKIGRAPAIVFVNDYPCKTASDWHLHGDHATVDVHGDVVQLLDTRYLVGLRVSISGSTEVRAKALAEKAKAAGASVVAASHAIKVGQRFATGWCEVWERKNG